MPPFSRWPADTAKGQHQDQNVLCSSNPPASQACSLPDETMFIYRNWMKNHPSANKSETYAQGSLHTTGKSRSARFDLQYYNGKGFPLIWQIALALKVYPNFNNKAPNLQIFPSTAAKVLSVRTLAANWGMRSQSNITITEHLQGHSNSILALQQIGVVPLHLPHTWQRTYNNVPQHSFQKLPDKASGSLSELQAPFPGYRDGQQRTKPCVIEPWTLAL